MQESNVCKCEKMPFSHKSRLSTNLHSFSCAVVGASLSWFPVSGIDHTVSVQFQNLINQVCQVEISAISERPGTYRHFRRMPRCLSGSLLKACGTCSGRIGGLENGELYILRLETESSVSEAESLDESESLNLQVHLQSLGVLSGTRPGDRGI